VRRLALVVGVLAGLLALAAPAAAATPVAGPVVAAQAPFVALEGHGYGHGRGMGQYGALGYALGYGWSYQQILGYYYGGTQSGQAPAGSIMTVDMTERDGQPTIVAQEDGLMTLSPSGGVTCAANTPCSVMLVRTAADTWSVYQGTGCNGGTKGWTVTAQNVSAPSITVTATAGATNDRDQMLQLCRDDGIQWLRGNITAVDTGSSQATVNDVPLDAYVQGVVPNESPDVWGGLGNGAGEQALMAQAVAARSYAMADSYAPYAKTCDTTVCQVYGGRAFQTQDGIFTDLEGTPAFQYSDNAVAATAGQVRLWTSAGSGPTGSIALTEFSSSTGGYTAGGAFPAVPDLGDSTASNPNHTWTTDVPSSAIQSAFGQSAAGQSLGTLESIQITGRNGLGDLGGRVTAMTLQFAGGSVQTTGSQFAGALGLKSNWFTVTAQPVQPGPTPTTPTAPATGYQVLTADGNVYSFEGAPSYGSLNAAAAGTTAVSLGEVPGGYDVLAGDGGVYVFGNANWYGSLKGKGLNAPPFQIITTPDGDGYWIVAFDGGVFAYGDAPFVGSTGGMRLNAPIVGMARTPDGRGYWLVAGDGGVFSFGDAAFYGSTGGMHLNQPVIGMAATADGRGYWLMGADGGVFSFGDAGYRGSLPGLGVAATAVGLAASGTGYVVATQAGTVYGFGAPAAGGPASDGATAQPVSIAVPS
jgi:SpoIID/LytB domain protein